jgi:hypothetical protein
MAPGGRYGAPQCRTVTAVYFVYRSHYEGQLSKQVRQLPDETVLAWFRRGWACEDPETWVETELGGDVYGLDSIFETAQEEDLPRPKTTGELRALLHEHLYVEGDEDYIRLDDHSLRVRTDDDEVELAYFFLDDDVVAAAPERLAYLLHESWPLPDQVSQPRPFAPEVPVTVATPAGPGEATTYAVFLTFYDGESLARLQPLAFPGVSLPALARHLRTADTPRSDDWPPELLVLRALIAPGEDAIRPALDRCNRWPGFNLNANPWPAMPDEHDAVHRRAMEMAAAGEYIDGRRPEASLLRVGDHLAQLAMHCGESFGYQQWYLFDTTWAATHPNLAQSLLRYADHWDPLDD